MKLNKIQGGAEVLINFEDWEIDNESSFGSGANEKKWLSFSSWDILDNTTDCEAILVDEMLAPKCKNE